MQSAKIFPDYHNIFIAPEDLPSSSLDEPEYDLDSSRITVADKQSAILFHPYSDMYEVLVKAEVVSKAPPLDPDKWDHIVEASLKGDRLFEGRRNKGPSLYELRLLNS